MGGKALQRPGASMQPQRCTSRGVHQRRPWMLLGFRLRLHEKLTLEPTKVKRTVMQTSHVFLRGEDFSRVLQDDHRLECIWRPQRCIRLRWLSWQWTRTATEAKNVLEECAKS